MTVSHRDQRLSEVIVMSQSISKYTEESAVSPTSDLPASLPDHTQLPDSDGKFVLAKRAGSQNFQEPPEGDFLSDCITPILQQLHPDGQYGIGRDSGIYWRLTEPPEAPD